MPIIPKDFDPNIAHVIDADGNIFQELAPVETVEVQGLRVAGEDDDGKPIVELVTEKVELPREWDEVKTVEAIEAAQEG